MLVVEVDGERRRAWADESMVGPAEPGDEVVVNTAALDLGLGSGGYDIVHVNLTRGLEGGETPPDVHVMKLNYSSLQHAVDPAYRRLPGVGFMMSDSSIKVVRKIKDGQSRPIFVPGFETGVPGGAPDTLLGSPVIVNQDVATMAANAKSILFGAFKNYKIRDVMSVQMFRFTDSAYTKLGQVGFLAWMRTGGNLVDVSGASVKYYQNSAT